MIPDGRTPVVVVTGFLGSGKTTLLLTLNGIALLFEVEADESGKITTKSWEWK